MQGLDDPKRNGNGLGLGTAWPVEGIETSENGLTRNRQRKCAIPGPGKFKDRARWSSEEDESLLRLAGERSARELGKLLCRTERSVYHRLARLNVSGKLKDGYTPRMLAEDLHVDRARVRQWLLDGKLESVHLHVTRDSIKSLCGKESTEIVWKGKVLAVLGRLPQTVLESFNRREGASRHRLLKSHRPRSIGKDYSFRRVGKILQVNQEAVKQLVAAGLLKLSRLRIEENAVVKFVKEYPEEINWGLVDADVLQWLEVCRSSDGIVAEKLPGPLKHLGETRTCPGCHRSCRGNGYGTHVRFCRQVRGLPPEVLEWAADHPKSADRKKPASLGNMEGKIQEGRYSSASERTTR